VLQFGLRSVFAGTEWRLAVALPVATATASPATTPTTPFTGLAFAEYAVFARLLLAYSVFLGRTRLVIFVSDYMFGDSVVRELLRALACRFAAFAAPAPPPPAAAFALALEASFGFRFGCSKFRLLR
jgi:hypothetical protein